MKPWQAMLIPIVGMAVYLVVAFCLLAFANFDVGPWPVQIMVVLTSAWAVTESVRLKTHQYERCGGPVAIGAGSMLLWMLVFPAFMFMRQKIINGTAQLRVEHLPAEAGAAPTANGA